MFFWVEIFRRIDSADNETAIRYAADYGWNIASVSQPTSLKAEGKRCYILKKVVRWRADSLPPGAVIVRRAGKEFPKVWYRIRRSTMVQTKTEAEVDAMCEDEGWYVESSSVGPNGTTSYFLEMITIVLARDLLPDDRILGQVEVSPAEEALTGQD